MILLFPIFIILFPVLLCYNTCLYLHPRQVIGLASPSHAIKTSLLLTGHYAQNGTMRAAIDAYHLVVCI